ncbi:MAG: cyclodeaminase/cyclohydrolase family protein [Ignavibacteriales bacterium]|nr:cyclodeaminase/cyclohydrolase family protein [Ignavibacteriales bacterium]
MKLIRLSMIYRQKAQEIKDKLIKNIDDDSNAFNEYMENNASSSKLTSDEKSARISAMQMQRGFYVS